METLRQKTKHLHVQRRELTLRNCMEDKNCLMLLLQSQGFSSIC